MSKTTAGLFSCLFSDVSSECSGRTNEHTILETLGGTRKTRDSICDKCNHHFGDSLDSRLGKYFEPLLHALGPIISGPTRKKIVGLRSISERLPIQIEAGGVASLSKVASSTRSGRFSLLGPDAAQLERIAKARGDALPRIVRVPLPTVLGDEELERKVVLGDWIRQAAAKVLLVVLDDQARRHGVTPYARHSGLRGVRRGIRSTSPSEVIRRGGAHPVFAAGDLFDSIFGVGPPTSFWNRCLFAYDSKKAQFAAMLQIANVLPLGFCVAGVDLGTRSFTCCFSKELTSSKAPVERFEQGLLVAPSELSATGFSTRTAEAAEFGFRQFRHSLAAMHGQATVAVDLGSDRELLIGLETYRDYALSRKGCSFHEAATSAIVELLKLRYVRHRVSESIWTKVEVSVAAQLQQSLSQGKTPPSVTTEVLWQRWRHDILTVFRRELALVVAEQGYPRLLRDISTTIRPTR
jgi:HNH endonuclease